MGIPGNFQDEDYWKAIILYGLNQATYKIALGKLLLEFANKGKNTISWSDLSKAFLHQYSSRLEKDPSPQQSNPSRLTVMERVVRQLEKGQVSTDHAIDIVGAEAFGDVIPRFQTIGVDRAIVKERFYEFDFGKRVILKDAIFIVSEGRKETLDSELEARWALLEGAFQIKNENWALANDARNIYLENQYARKNLLHTIPFLSGYQTNTCFYCGEPLDLDQVNVDHVLPRQVVGNDEIWNLVLAHSICNYNKSDFLVGRHYIEKLIFRNENIMGSNHPWKNKVATTLGNTADQRASNTWKHYENVGKALNNRFWENSPRYNRETDSFFKRLITVLNNKE